MGGRGNSPPPQFRDTNMGGLNLNPHISGIGGAGAESLRITKEREEINLRGRVLQEQLMSKGAGLSGATGDIAMSN